MVELMIVISIVGLLLAIAIPNFFKVRQAAETKHCLDNLRLIDSAKEQWGMEHHAYPDSPGPSLSDLVGPMGYIKSTPTCPVGGTYTVGPVTTFPTCSIGGEHALQ